MKKTKTVYTCDNCDADLPDAYVTTDGEGRGYLTKDAYEEIPLEKQVRGCSAMVVHVQLGGRCDTAKYNDLCDTCRLALLREAVEYLEKKVGGE